MSRGLFCAAAALTVLSSITAVGAMPASIGASLQPDASSVTKVQFYPGYVATPLDVPAAVIGGTVGLVTGALSTGFYGPAYGPYQVGVAPFYGSLADRMAACAANYISFDPVTGTYTTYEGFQVLCPFLRY